MTQRFHSLADILTRETIVPGRGEGRYEPPPAEPPCPVCGGIGWVRQGLAQTVHCDACRVNAPRPQARAERRPVGDIPDSLRRMTFATFRPDGASGQHSGLRLAYAGMELWAGAPTGWRVLSGGHGVGKTHLMAAAAGAVAPQRRVFWANSLELLDRLRMLYATDAVAEGYELLEEARTADLLALDDLGRERPTPFTDERLYLLLQARYGPPGRPTVITTALSPDELRSRYGWLASILGDRSVVTVMRIDAPDYRREL